MKPSEVLGELDALKKYPKRKVLGVVFGIALIAVAWTFVSAYVAELAKRDKGPVPSPTVQPPSPPDQRQVALLMADLASARQAVTRDAKDRCEYIDGLALDGTKPEPPEQAQARKTNTENLRRRFAEIAAQLTDLGVTDFDHNSGAKPAHCGAELIGVENPRTP